MKKSFFIKDFFVYALNGFLVKLFSFITIPLIVRFFSVEEFGIIDSMLSILGFIALFIGMGYDISMKKSMIIGEKVQDKNSHILTNFIFLIIWGGLFSGILLIFNAPLSKLIFSSNKYNLTYIYAIISCYLNALIGLFLTIARIEFERKKFLYINVFKTLFEYMLIILLLFLKKEVHHYFLAIVIIDFFFLMILLFLNRSRFKGKFRKELVLDIYTFGIPAMISGIGYWIFNMSDRIMISNITGSTYQTGLYSMIIKMFSIYTFIVAAFKQAWIPRAFQLYRYNKEDFVSKIEIIQKYTLIIFSTIAIFNLAGSRLMITVFATKEYIVGIKSLYPIVMAFIIYPLTMISSIGLYISNNTKKMSGIVWVAALINILINYLLIGKIGILAAGISTLVSYSYIYIFYWRVSCRTMDWKINWKEPIIILIIAFVSVIMINFVNINNIFFDLFIKLLLAFMFIILMFIMKFVDIKTVKNIMKEIFKIEPKEKK